MDKYNINPTDNLPNRNIKNIYIGEVVYVGKINVTDDDIRRKFNSNDVEKVKKRIERFNSDEHAIKVVIQGGTIDGRIDRYELLSLPNCYPLLPKHLNFTPQVGELVIILAKENDKLSDDRFYIGPIISSQTRLDKDLSVTALSNFSDGLVSPSQEISKIPLARGIYENTQNVVINGRGSTDIIQRDNEILIRSGKFLPNDRLKFNSKNPGIIQIKSDFNLKDSNTGNSSTISVTNVISDKINLLTYNGSPNLSSENGLTKVNKQTGVAEYIDDNKLKEIIETAHPLVFGDLLIEYLLLLKNALLNHVHNGNGNIPTDKLPASTIYDLNQKAENLEKSMLSKNIRIN